MKQKSAILLLVMALLLANLPPVTAQEGAPTHTGTIDNDTSFVEIPLTVEADGSLITLDLRATSGNLDTLLYLVDGNGLIVAQNDDRERGNTNSLIEFPQADAGQYTVIATRYKVTEGDSTGEFALTITVGPGETTAVQAYPVSEADLAAAGYPPLAPRATADWTILAYYGGDTNLEASLMNDFNEFEVAGGSSDRVRIVMLLDRHPEYTDASGNWATTRLFEIGPDVPDPEGTFPPTLDSTELADLGVVDTSSGETLAQFLVWGLRNFPAQHYAVALASHGAGWQGLITDDSSGDTSGNTILTLPELQRAFESATAAAGVDKLDLLIDDACLMSSVEYYGVVSHYFNYSLASPEIVVDPALDMTLLTQTIQTDPATALAALGTALVDTYITRDTHLRTSSDVGYFTEALTDLNQFDPVVAAVERFASLVNEDPERYAALLGQARSNTYTYTAFLGNNTLIDTGSLMRQVMALSSDEPVILAAQQVLSALSRAKVYGNAGERAASRISYYNIYFPEESKDFRVSYFSESPLQEWGKMLRSYYNTLTPQVWIGDTTLAFHPPVAPQITITNSYPDPASIWAPVTMTMELVGRKISRGDFIVDQVQPDGSAIRLTNEPIVEEVVDDSGYVDYVNKWHSGVEVSEISWDTTLPVVTDGQVTAYELLTQNDELSFLEGRYREPGSEEWNDVGVVFSVDENATGLEETVQRVVSRNPGNDALGVIHILPGSEFQAYRSVVTADGRVISEPGNTYTWPEGGLRVRWGVPAPSGLYHIGFLITAFGGTTGFASQTVTVNNDGLDPALRGYIDTYHGYHILYPANWDEPSETDQGYTEADNETYTQRIAVYPVEATFLEATLAEMIGQFADDNAYEFDGDLSDLTIDGRPALAFHYNDGEGEVGRGFGVAAGEEGSALVFVAGAEGGEDYEANFQLLTAHTSFFDVEALNATDTGRWDNTSIGTFYTAEFPERRDWYMFDRDIWLGYAPDETLAESLTFAAVTQLLGSDARAILDALLADYVQPGGEGYTLTETRTYYGENHTWETALYTITRRGQPIRGRLYVTTVDSGHAYAMWFETPEGDTAQETFATIFEPMLDGLEVPSPLRTFTSPEFGFSLQYPRPWYYLEYYADGGLFYTVSADLSESINVYPVQDAPADLETLARDAIDANGLELTGDFAPITVAGQDALEFTYSLGGYDGRAFAVYLAGRRLGLIFGVETRVDTGRAAEIYRQLVSTVRFLDRPEAETGGQGEGAPAAVYAREWRTVTLAELGIAFPYPATWEDFLRSTEGVQMGYSPSARTTLDIVTIEGVTDLRELPDFYEDLDGEPAVVTVDGQPAIEFAYHDNETDPPTHAQALGLYREQTGTGIILAVEAEQPGGEIEPYYSILRDGLTIFAPVAAEEAVPEGGDLQEFTNEEFGFALRFSADWDAMEYDEENGLFLAFNEDGTALLAVYVVPDGGADLDALAETVLEWYGMSLAGEYTPTTIQGQDALEFGLSYEADGTWTGRAFAVEVGGAGLVFSAESTDAAQIDPLYQTLVENVSLVD